MYLVNSQMEIDSSQTLMKNIRELCSLMNIRQADLAGYMGLKSSQMSLYYNGKVDMRTDRLLLLLGILGIDLNKILADRIQFISKHANSDPFTESRVLASLGRLSPEERRSLHKIVGVISGH